ncbi:MAG: metallophosphoesterase, partial [candidate division WOR-3 bacterium]
IANRLCPDLIALTGDYVSFSRYYISASAEILSDLRSRYGIYAVLGNHDFLTGASALEHAFRKRGIDLLRNAHTQVRKGSEELTLIGIDDLTLGEDNLPAALHGINGQHPKILLSHNPNIIWQAAEHEIDLVLSGHTHGGQINVPSWRRRARRFWPFLRGYGQLDQTQIYVNRGLGTVLVPVRFKCPPEITLIELKR